MCGITAIINQSGAAVDATLVNAMNDRIIHRGPDDAGVYLNGPVALGHRRLSILDLSSAGHQPMEYQGNWISYNGEVYNYLELRETLQTAGYSFSTQTDTEVILAAYHHWGEDCLRHFNGMWAFVIYDLKQQKLFCSRDRFGIKPFCYTQAGNDFLMGSEAKQFLEHPEFTPTLNEAAVYEYLNNSHLCTSERTLLEGVKLLPGGHQLVYDLRSHQVDVSRWYNLHSVRQVSTHELSFDEAGQQFAELLTDSVRLRLRSDVKVGSCLSGGMDSSSIVSAAKQHTPQVHTVSSCYDDKRYDEQEYIDIVNQALGTEPYKVFPNLNDLLEKGLLEKIVYHQDQPIFTASHFSEYSVFDTAAQHQLTVMLDGQGADEYLAGYGRYALFYWKDLLKRGKWQSLWREIRGHSAKQGQHPLRNLAHLAYFLWLARWRSADGRLLAFGSQQPAWLEANFYERYKHLPSLKPHNRKEWKNLFDISKHELLVSSVPYQLHSEDRNSMLHSVESRLPFLDYRLVEFSLSLPDEYKLRDGATKAVLRHGLSEMLPKEIVHRHAKMGFAAPDQVWMKDNHGKIRAELDNALQNLAGILHPNLLIDFDTMVTEGKPFNNIYFMIISLNYWIKAFGVQRRTPSH